MLCVCQDGYVYVRSIGGWEAAHRHTHLCKQTRRYLNVFLALSRFL